MLVRLALASGASPDAQQRGWPVIGVAASRGMTEIVSTLIAGGADVHRCPKDDDRSALYWAAANHHHETVKVLVTAGADGEHGALARAGWTPLHVAARHAGAAVIQSLLDAGSDPNASVDGGVTPLWVAAATLNSDAVRLLLDAGADPDAVSTHKGWTAPPLVAAAMSLAHTQLMDARHAADDRASKTIGMLLARGADALARGSIKALGSTKTALHYAAEAGAMSTAETLLSFHPESVSVWDSNGMLPLHAAVYHADHSPDAERVALRMLHLVEDPMMKRHWTREPDHARSLLHLAAGSGAVGVMRFLIEDERFDIDQVDAQGNTPLHYAASMGKFRAILLLIEAGADASIRDAEGRQAYDLLEARVLEAPSANNDTMLDRLFRDLATGKRSSSGMSP